ncbi:hypothetical protein [Streptomyces apricus]|uniref:Uncharacterized protein n=1 Tax=Streptomyces apricus TaxID=1828112 RepID=A0A5B0BQM4_9ACTN|nr:hypothetical protein [Streptomyces apricus]KAA0943125.1 hypothetical protein FGF04_00580 [Streptomyces apricus]
MDRTRPVAGEPVPGAREHAPGPALLELRIAGASVELTVRDDVGAPVGPRGGPVRSGRPVAGRSDPFS